MDLNIRHFILLLFILACAAIFLLKPHHVARIDKREIPQIAFIDFESYEIRPEGVTDHLKGREAKKYPHMLRVRHAELLHLAPKGKESVRADEAIFMEKRGVELKENVHLLKSGGWRLDTSRLYYIPQKKIYTTRGADFVITYGKSVIHGKNLYYYQKSGKIKAESIHARIAEEDI